MLLLVLTYFVGRRKLVIYSFASEFLVEDEFGVLKDFLGDDLGAFETKFEEVLSDFICLAAPD